jgi:ethanolamine-phosphate cytidylyltransferase
MAIDSAGNIPAAGRWPVDPQEDVSISKDRIWVDGCFDFAHHGKQAHSAPSLLRDSLHSDESTFVQGHAGAMLQARRLGKELLVGIHSDEEIMDNKGPTVMTLEERWGLTY